MKQLFVSLFNWFGRRAPMLQAPALAMRELVSAELRLVGGGPDTGDSPRGGW